MPKVTAVARMIASASSALYPFFSVTCTHSTLSVMSVVDRGHRTQCQLACVVHIHSLAFSGGPVDLRSAQVEQACFCLMHRVLLTSATRQPCSCRYGTHYYTPLVPQIASGKCQGSASPCTAQQVRCKRHSLKFCNAKTITANSWIRQCLHVSFRTIFDLVKPHEIYGHVRLSDCTRGAYGGFETTES